MMSTKEMLSLNEQYGARNYLPLPVVLSQGQGVWVSDPEGNRYIDMLSAYSAMNFGHCHPEIINALKKQAEKITLTSRAFHNDQLGAFCQSISSLTSKGMILPMNTGAEAIETAIKAVRRWAYRRKNVVDGQAEIIACKGNFHGRTISIVSFSSDVAYKSDFGPLTPGFKIIEYGDINALKKAINRNTAGFLVEPIQGEGGIIIPPDGYLAEAYKICQENNVLFIADEIQTGLGRTGKMFACDWEHLRPDVYILGKALGGGVLPISAVAANEEVLDVFEPGSHGSTFGGNPLACAVALKALEVIQKEKLVENSAVLGSYFLEELRRINSSIITEVRGKGLMIGVELDRKARPFCEKLMKLGVLAKETHDNVIRLAPPLIIKEKELEKATDALRIVLG